MAIGLALLLIGWLEYSGLTGYGQLWPAKGPPPYVNWCGSHYEPTHTSVTLTEAQDAAGESLGPVGTTPAFLSVLAQAQFGRRGGPRLLDTCPSQVFVEVGGDQLEVYRQTRAAT